MTTGGGADVINIAATHSAIALGFVANTVAPTAAISTVGMDVITGFSAGATIVTGIDFTGAMGNSTSNFVRNGGTLGTGANAALTTNAMIVGIYNESANSFTPSLVGTDTLLALDTTGIAAGTAYMGIVLIGYVDLNQNDTLDVAGATGVFTSVLG
jgi:hypothetical protein